jgi:hypothetical protein
MLCNNQIRRSVINAHVGNLNSVHAVEVAHAAAPAMTPYVGMRLSSSAATGRCASSLDGFRAGERDEHRRGLDQCGHPTSTGETSKRCSKEQLSTLSPKVAELPAAIWAAFAIQRALSL